MKKFLSIIILSFCLGTTLTAVSDPPPADIKYLRKVTIGTDGSYKEYDEDGELWSERKSDGSYKEYYKNGKPREERKSNGSSKIYNEKGHLKTEVQSDGSYKIYNQE